MAARHSALSLAELTRLPCQASRSLGSSSVRIDCRTASTSASSTSRSTPPLSRSSSSKYTGKVQGQPYQQQSSALGTKLTPEQILSHFSRGAFTRSTNLLGDNAELACRAMTHESYRNAMQGHNRRLAFLGRRSLKMFVTLYLHAQLQSASDTTTTRYLSKLLESPAPVDAMLTTQRLGDKIGRHLELEKVMKWTPNVMDSQLGSRETGLFKIRGVCVEALLGAVYHERGAQVASQFFNTSILPLLVTEIFPSPVPASLKQQFATPSQM